MSNLLYRFTSPDESEVHLGFHCPGCGYGHSYRIKGDNQDYVWQWNGSMDKPTFTPSLLVNKEYPEKRCHLHVTDGKIIYCGDCFHSLSGKTVDMVPED